MKRWLEYLDALVRAGVTISFKKSEKGLIWGKLVFEPARSWRKLARQNGLNPHATARLLTKKFRQTLRAGAKSAQVIREFDTRNPGIKKQIYQEI